MSSSQHLENTGCLETENVTCESDSKQDDSVAINAAVRETLSDLLDDVTDGMRDLKTQTNNETCEGVNKEDLELDGSSSKTSTRRQRSTSERNAEEKSSDEFITRRKFGSESEIEPLLLKNISLQQKELDAVIGKYVNRLIRSSICNAIKNVNVDGLYEEIVKEFSSRSSSESIETAVEQRLTSNSISELVELEVDFQDKGVVASSPETGIKECHDVSQTILPGYLADLEDTESLDDSKSMDEESALDASNGSVGGSRRKSSDKTILKTETNNDAEIVNSTILKEAADDKNIVGEQLTKEVDSISSQSNENHEHFSPVAINTENVSNTCLGDNTDNICKEGSEDEPKDNVSANQNIDLIIISSEDGNSSVVMSDSKDSENVATSPDLGENLPQQRQPQEEEKKISWKVGYLHVKLPPKARGKTNLKAWKKRKVAIQPDEFVNDPQNPSVVISIYGTSDNKRHTAIFWQTVSGRRAVVYRSSSKSHKYAFTVAAGQNPVVHLSAESETSTQEWMAAIRSILWPPSPFMQLEKMLSGREFEISLIDNDFSYRAGLLGMYGYLTITPKKLILLHPQEGYVIQEWYLNTVDKFELRQQAKAEDAHKVLAMITCSDSSTGKGEILFFCNEAVTLLQSLASTIHQILTYHDKQEGGKYKKELEEIGEWLLAPPQDSLVSDDHYKVPTRQVKSLLDIPNFIFKKSLSPVASAVYPAPNSNVLEPLEATREKPTRASRDSGISTSTSMDDFLNCSTTSFVVGGGPMTGKSSDSELSDIYTPPRSPAITKKIASDTENSKDELTVET